MRPIARPRHALAYTRAPVPLWHPWLPSPLAAGPSRPRLSLHLTLCLAHTHSVSQAVRGDFDEAGRLDPASSRYWAALDEALELRSPLVKHVRRAVRERAREGV